jgi:hypothetical protein
MNNQPPRPSTHSGARTVKFATSPARSEDKRFQLPSNTNEPIKPRAPSAERRRNSKTESPSPVATILSSFTDSFGPSQEELHSGKPIKRGSHVFIVHVWNIIKHIHI